jgi:hypothetical protein
MIEMIFEGGYTYAMAEVEFMQLLTLAGIGAATLMVGGLGLMYYVVRLMIKDFKKR